MKTYKHLSCAERTLIQLSLEQGCKLRAIGHNSPQLASRAEFDQPRIAP
ncbi:MAG: helix-turn-helix domain-containing protein [Burkholderia sp.]